MSVPFDAKSHHNTVETKIFFILWADMKNARNGISTSKMAKSEAIKE